MLLSLGVLLLALFLLIILRKYAADKDLRRRLSALNACQSNAAGPGEAPPQVPPCVPGLPLLGSALPLGSGGAAFLRQCREEYGDAFTLRLLGQRMTFVFAPAALQHYFVAPDTQLTFAPAVQQFTHRVFGLPPKHFYNRHLHMLQTLRHQLVPGELGPHNSRLLHQLMARLQRWPASGQLELVAELKSLVFEAAVATLFGPQFLGLGDREQQQQRPGAQGSSSSSSTSNSSSSNGRKPSRAQQLQRDFFVFEEGFELAASPLPHLFQPSFLAARRRLLAALRQSYAAGHFEGTVAGSLVQACGLPEQYVPNMLLAVLWASQANAVPTAFWSLGFLLLPENQQHLQSVRREAEQAAGASSGSSGHAATGAAACDALLLSPAQQAGLLSLAPNRHSHAAAAVAEAMRLRSFSIDVRIAAADTVLPAGSGSSSGGDAGGYFVQKGDVVAISPFESHLDPRLYQPAPATYNPHRQGMQLGGSAVQHAAVVGVGGVPGLSFGGGKYRCPGRYFAEAELSLILSLLVLLFDWQLLPAEQGGGSSQAASRGSSAGGPPGDPACLLPPPNLRKLVGIKVPEGPCWVQYRRRQVAAAS